MRISRSKNKRKIRNKSKRGGGNSMYLDYLREQRNKSKNATKLSTIHEGDEDVDQTLQQSANDELKDSPQNRISDGLGRNYENDEHSKNATPSDDSEEDDPVPSYDSKNYDSEEDDLPPSYDSENYYVKGGKNKTKGKQRKTKRHRKTKKRRNKI